MQMNLALADAASFATPLLVVFAVDIATGPSAEPLPTLLVTEDAISDAAAAFLTSGEFKAASGDLLLRHAPAGLKCERLLIVGLGKARDLTPKQVRMGSGSAIRAAKQRAIRNVSIAFPEDRALSDEALESLPCLGTGRSLAEGALLADFDPDIYRSDRKDRSMHTLTLVVHARERSTQDEIRLGFSEGQVVAEAQNFARSLVNEPPNILTPGELGRRAQAMADAHGLRCEVHSTERMQQLGMGAFLAVAQGSAQPPALIELHYEPATAPSEGAPVLALVGKGITFDTGGISIKPAENMDKMKYDMAGAAAMLGAMQAIAQLKPAVRVISIVCAAENMPSGTAYRPGDVLTAMSGKTIEVMNTDAEGRLVLADGIAYAKQLGATHLIDAATLTGACVIALGQVNGGLFSNDEDTCAAFQRAMVTAGESFWRLPCTDDYKEQIKSQIADIMNTGMSRAGGAVTAAMFLKEFAGETPWVHLDIAGMAWIDDARPHIARGPSGIAVRSIVEWVREMAR